MKTCKTCKWFVEETDIIGDYQHEEAVRLGSGFCLIHDFFDKKESDYPACEEYVNENENNSKSR